MKLYFDTSALIKAFHQEHGTDIVIKLLSADENLIYVSELTRIEFKSALYRRFNNHQISEVELQIAIKGFNDYLQQINVEPLTTLTIEETENLFDKYYVFGLRTLDALQLATFTLLSDKEMQFVTADDKLCKIVETAGFITLNPTNNIKL